MTTMMPLPIATGSTLCAGPALSPASFSRVRLQTIFNCCKWDPQVGDVSSLADFPLILSQSAWNEISTLAEQLATETLAAERELLHRPDLLGELALPAKLTRWVARHQPPKPAPAMASLMRFDFHWTSEGWRISEVNSDVPGGFIEASGFSSLMAIASPGELSPAGDPAATYAQAIANRLGAGTRVAMVHATAYSDDRQVMQFLSHHLKQLGVDTVMAAPDHLMFCPDRVLCCGEHVHGLVRFFPAEWLMNYRRKGDWESWLAGGWGGDAVPLSNPASALLVQSKRLPLVWDRLKTAMPTWRRLLPETRSVGRFEDVGREWVLKPALGRVGDGVLMAGVTEKNEAAAVRRSLRFWPRHFLAQRRFDTIAIPTPRGPRFPCLGVYTIDGHAAGIYGRISTTPVIDHQAQDIAVLVSPDRPAL